MRHDPGTLLVMRVPVRRIAREILDFCYPGTCAACGGACDGDVMLCEESRIELPASEIPRACPSCARPLAEPDAPCAHCGGKGIALLERVLRVGLFVDPLKHL